MAIRQSNHWLIEARDYSEKENESLFVMFETLLLLIIVVDFTANQNLGGHHPILVASPYPFNSSEAARVRCFTNEQGVVLSLTITADLDASTAPLRSAEKELSNNGSVTLDIVAPFNYSRFESKIRCLSKFHHGVEETAELDVLSVAEIVQPEHLSIKVQAKQASSLHCRTYGTDVGKMSRSGDHVSHRSRDSCLAIRWDFTTDPSTNNFTRLPLGIRLAQRLTTNDTLIIPRVSLDDHQGYYRCSASNELLGRSYEDQHIIALTVQKSRIWIPIVIVCLVAGLCILLVILCARYWQQRRKKVVNANEASIDDIEQSISTEKDVVRSPQFVLGNPFLDAEVPLVEFPFPG